MSKSCFGRHGNSQHSVMHKRPPRQEWIDKGCLTGSMRHWLIAASLLSKVLNHLLRMYRREEVKENE